MNSKLCTAVLALTGLTWALPVVATVPGWYLQGNLGYSKVDDADSTLKIEPGFTPGTQGTPGTPGMPGTPGTPANICTGGLTILGLITLFPAPGSPSSSCDGALLIPGLINLFPTPSTPGTPGTPSTPGTPGTPSTPGTSTLGSENDFKVEYDDGRAFGAAIGYARPSGLRTELELRINANDVAQVTSESTRGAGTGEVTASTLLANLWWDFNPDGKWHPYIGAGAGGAKVEFKDVAVDLGGSGLSGFSADDTVFAYQAGVGIEADVSETVALGLALRYFATADPEFSGDKQSITTEYKQQLALLTLRWVFSPAVIDSDGDGVPDNRDNCPDTPKGVAVDASGCPLDSDGDGIPDYLDQCPNTPAGVPVDSNGCPLDSDGDGIPDYKDQCPNTPAGVQVDANGCPLVIDSDGDGVPDDRDLCPNTPPGVPVLTNGCAVGQGVILDGVNFLFDKATLTESAETILLGVAQTLKDSPGFEIEVAGHTDSIGSDAYNLKLSQERVESAVDFLVAQGVDRDRLNPVGYGETRPIAPNTNPDGSDNPEGRAKNRRVELNVIGQN